MSVFEPDDSNEMFEAMRQSTLSDLEGEQLPGDAVVLNHLSNRQLIKRWERVKIDLRKIGEMHHQRTERGRQLQSEYQAIKYLLHDRGLQ